MTFRQRKPAGDALPETRRLISAKYDGKCSCGTKISVGDLIYYDPLLLKKALCRRCGQKVSKALKEVEPTSEAQIVVDRLKQLESLPGLSAERQEEFDRLKQKLIGEFLHDADARNYLFVDVFLPGRITPAKAITATRIGKCLVCMSEQFPGATVLWDPASHKILCADCGLRQSPELVSG
jgi:hypothetical protein